MKNHKTVSTTKFILKRIIPRSETDNKFDQEGEHLVKRNNVRSAFNNFNKTMPRQNKVNKFNQIQNSEIMFEDFSYQSRVDNYSSIDYYQKSKDIYEFLNKIRMQPELLITILNNLLNEVKNQENTSSTGKNDLVTSDKTNISAITKQNLNEDDLLPNQLYRFSFRFKKRNHKFNFDQKISSRASYLVRESIFKHIRVLNRS